MLPKKCEQEYSRGHVGESPYMRNKVRTMGYSFCATNSENKRIALFFVERKTVRQKLGFMDGSELVK